MPVGNITFFEIFHCLDKKGENKKAKGTKKCVIKRNLKFENYKNCLKATQLKNKINQNLIKKHEKYKYDIDHIKENHGEFIRNNESILKTH